MSYFGVSLRNGASLGLGTVPALSNPPLLYRLAPSLLLQFAGAETLDSRITFTRTTTATRTNSSGLIESVAINGPRFDYNPTTLAPNGLLIEEQRTNLVTYSEQLDNAAWTKVSSTVASNSVIAPDGTLTGDTLIADASTGEHYAECGFSVTSGNTYTFTAYIKAAGLTNIALRFTIGALWTGSASPQVRFNLINLTASTQGGTPASASITNAGNGWYRAQMSAVAISTGNASARFQLMSGGSNTFTGDGTSGIYIWGAQLEAGAFPTSYIPTVASQVTRTADVATMTGTNFSSWYNATEGTMYAGVVSAPVANIAQQAWYISDNTSSNNIALRRNSGGLAAVAVNAGGVAQADVSGGAVSASAFYKFAAAYKVNDFAVSLNAGAIATDTSGSIPVVSQLNIGATAAGTQYLNGTIKQIVYYPRRLANSELQAITS